MSEANEEPALMQLLEPYEGLFCLECRSLCEIYEQGLACNCGHRWETEVLDERRYPTKWVRCRVHVYGL